MVALKFLFSILAIFAFGGLLCFGLPASPEHFTFDGAKYPCGHKSSKVVAIFGVSVNNTANINTGTTMKPLYLHEDFQSNGLRVQLPNLNDYAKSSEYLIGNTENTPSVNAQGIEFELQRKDLKEFLVESVVLPKRVKSFNDTDENMKNFVSGAVFYNKDSQVIVQNQAFESDKNEIKVERTFSSFKMQSVFYSQTWSLRDFYQQNFFSYSLKMKPTDGKGAGFWVCAMDSAVNDSTINTEISSDDQDPMVDMVDHDQSCPFTYNSTKGIVTDCRGNEFALPCQAGGEPLVIYSRFPDINNDFRKPAFVKDGFRASSLRIAGELKSSSNLTIEASNPSGGPGISFYLEKKDKSPFTVDAPYFPSIVHNGMHDQRKFAQNYFFKTDSFQYASVVGMVANPSDWETFFLIPPQVSYTKKFEATLLSYREDTPLYSKSKTTIRIVSDTTPGNMAVNGFWVCGSSADTAEYSTPKSNSSYVRMKKSLLEKPSEQ